MDQGADLAIITSTWVREASSRRKPRSSFIPALVFLSPPGWVHGRKHPDSGLHRACRPVLIHSSGHCRLFGCSRSTVSEAEQTRRLER